MPKTRTVVQGECIDSISLQEGIPSDRIWSFSGNQKLKADRKDLNVLLPTDKVVIPDPVSNWVEGKATSNTHQFRLKPRLREYRIRALLAGTAPKALEYTSVEVDGKKMDTTASGEWIVCQMPLNAAKAVIQIKDWGSYEVELGNLDPLDTPSGKERRLQDLGYFDGLPEGMDVNQDNAMKLFQQTHAPYKDAVPTEEEKKKLGQLVSDPVV